MQYNLLHELVNRNIIGPLSEVDAHYVGLDMAGIPLVPVCGNFVIKKIDDNGTAIILHVADSTSGAVRRIRHDAIERIEGMAPGRLAETYGIGEDGGALSTRSRRGRKPRSVAEPEDDDDDE